MIMDFMKLITMVTFLFVVFILPIVYLVHVAYMVIKDKEWRRVRREKKFYRQNYHYENGTKKLNGAWHK